MPEIGTSGSMSGDGKRGVAEWPKLPRPSSTLPLATVIATCRAVELAQAAANDLEFHCGAEGSNSVPLSCGARQWFQTFSQAATN